MNFIHILYIIMYISAQHLSSQESSAGIVAGSFEQLPQLVILLLNLCQLHLQLSNLAVQQSVPGLRDCRGGGGGGGGGVVGGCGGVMV